MKQPNGRVLQIKLEHTGEQLTMWRTKDGNGVEELQMTGSLPAPKLRRRCSYRR